MNKEQLSIVEKITEEVKKRLSGGESGHDWFHIERVLNNAKHINAKEHGDEFIVVLAALLHDIADWKFHGGDESVGPRVAREIMHENLVEDNVIYSVCEIIATMSFKGARVANEVSSLEGRIVQDADRLDAIGAIGIARALTFGGFKNRPLHIPGEPPTMHDTKEAYAKKDGTTYNHFFEKLLLLKDLMNTATAREIAEERHAFMDAYLKRFIEEWEGRA